MDNNLLAGFWRLMVSLPPRLWRGQVAKSAHGTVAALAFMSAEHHRVRDLVVRELPGAGRPLPPEYIAQALGLPQERVEAILDELEAHMTFLVRNEQGAVTWAYPVTVECTPHQVTYSTGEQGYAA